MPCNETRSTEHDWFSQINRPNKIQTHDIHACPQIFVSILHSALDSKIALRKLLLNEESPEVAQLPRASNAQNRKLQQSPPHNPGIHALADIPELRLAFALEDLLALDVLQARVQVAHLLDHVLDLVLVRALDLRGVADGHVELELDAAG